MLICMTHLQNARFLSHFSLRLFLSSVIMNTCLLRWDTDVGDCLKALHQCMAHTCWEKPRLQSWISFLSIHLHPRSLFPSILTLICFFLYHAFCAVVFIHHSGSETQMVVGWMFDQWLNERSLWLLIDMRLMSAITVSCYITLLCGNVMFMLPSQPSTDTLAI